MRALTLFGVFGLLASITGCSAAPENDAAASSDDALSSGTPSYVTIRHDTRRCAAPLCGGYFVRDVNRHTAEKYVSGLDFVKSGLDDASIAKVTEADDDETVLFGRLSNADPAYGTQSLLVFGAWRGMPGITFKSTATFYTATDFNPPVECFVAPCPEGQAQKLNSTAYPKNYNSVDVTGAQAAFTDGAWIARQLTAHGGIAAGSIAGGVLTAQQVFVKLPLQMGPCKEVLVAQCPSDTPVRTYSRDAEHCMNPTSCVSARPCPFFRPLCPDGYTLSGWPTEPNGCSASVCDPTFITE